MHLLLLVAIVQISLAQYEVWKVSNWDNNKDADCVMYTCDAFNEHLAQIYPDDDRKYGIHVSVCPPNKDANGHCIKGAKGNYVHTSWETHQYFPNGPLNAYIWKRYHLTRRVRRNGQYEEVKVHPHWGWTTRSLMDPTEVWWPTKADYNQNLPQSEYEPLKQAWDLFAEYGYTDDQNQRHDLFLDQTKKDEGKLKRYPNPDRPPPQQQVQQQQVQPQQLQQPQQPQQPQQVQQQHQQQQQHLGQQHQPQQGQPPHQPQQGQQAPQKVAQASIDYVDHYDKYTSNEHIADSHHNQHEDTESSISVPTIFVTLVSFISICIVCTLYTGCISLISGIIGYKIKESDLLHKDQKVDSFQEI